MTLDKYSLFVAGSILLVITPGPDMAYLLARTIAQGRKAGIVAALGFNAGGYCHLLAATIGLSAMLVATPWAFTAVKWLGAAYLIYLGLQALIGSRPAVLPQSGSTAAPRPLRTIFRQAFLSDILNPKVQLFFLAYLPQFVDRTGDRRVIQLLMLGVTLCMIALAINIPLVFVAGRVTEKLRRNGRTALRLTRAMGVVFILIGLRMVIP